MRCIERAMLKKGEIEVGEYIYFGRYEKDHVLSNGKEKIDWLVLERKGNRLFVVSKYVLDCIPYHKVNQDVCWEDSSIYQWLNGLFVNEAFSDEQRKLIMGDVLLLSEDEVERCFRSSKFRMCIATAHGLARGVYGTEYEGVCCWWLRSKHEGKAAYVDFVGNVNYTFPNCGMGVRPALWINLDKEEG